MIEEINRGRVKGRKEHQCFDCYRMIPKGVEHSFATLKYDEIYTLRWHDDCHTASAFYQKECGFHFNDFIDGIPPLADLVSDYGEREKDLSWMRGHFPHVVCRLELNEQMSDLRFIARMRSEGRSNEFITAAMART